MMGFFQHLAMRNDETGDPTDGKKAESALIKKKAATSRED